MCVVGLGLLGGSWALGVKARRPGWEVIGVEQHPGHARRALADGLCDRLADFTEGVAAADLTVLAVPVDAIARLLPTALDATPPGGVVVDLGSTKGRICRAVATHPRRDRFVALHPIAGTEFSGPTAAFAGLLPGRLMIVCAADRSAPDALARAESLCDLLEMRRLYLAPDEHDRHLAFVSHLSHLSSFALSLAVLDAEQNERHIFATAGSGFASTVRLAKSAPETWRPIFEENRTHVLAALRQYQAELQTLERALADGDSAALLDLMRRANDIRRVIDRGVE